MRLQPILETQVKLRIRTPRQTVARLQKQQQQNMCLKTVARLAIENKFPIFERQTFYRLCSQTKKKTSWTKEHLNLSNNFDKPCST